jgi:hypothetical protein
LVIETSGKEDSRSRDGRFARLRYEKELRAKEARTCYIEKVQLRQIRKILKGRTPVTSITTTRLQHYIDARSKQKNRKGQPISHETIRKEIGTFGSMWNKFGVPQGPSRSTLESASRSGSFPSEWWKRLPW